ncbi:EAL domain protein [mine drainage metagenome]|uniref:EAL domain protein n=1 Tax=mine drainage metagenome TaxID=410659 RepID=A0A1J5SYQ4_9ZZZZ
MRSQVQFAPRHQGISHFSAAADMANAQIGLERDLLQDLAKYRKGSHGWRAVHVLSAVLAKRSTFPQALKEANAAIAAVLMNGAGYRIYNLGNGDVVFIYSQVATTAVMALCTALENSFFEGATASQNVYGECGHYKLFDLARELPVLIDGVRAILAVGQERCRKPPISPKHAVIISEKLRGSNIRSVIFNQPVYNIAHPRPSIEFLEFYTSIADLEKIYAPDRSIAGNPWLFNLIKRELDMALMRAIQREIGDYRHKAFSINLLVDSFLSDGFRAFLTALPVKLGGRVYAELEKSDLVLHSHLLGPLLERSRQLGVPVCIDGVSHHDVQLMRLSDLQCSYIKLKWDADIATAPEEAMVRLVRELRACEARVVLTRCDSPKALSFARATGISYVQGRLADEIFKSGHTLET